MLEMLAALVVFGFAAVVIVASLAIVKLAWNVVKFAVAFTIGLALVGVAVAFVIPLVIIGLVVAIPVALIAAIT